MLGGSNYQPSKDLKWLFEIHEFTYKSNMLVRQYLSAEDWSECLIRTVPPPPYTCIPQPFEEPADWSRTGRSHQMASLRNNTDAQCVCSRAPLGSSYLLPPMWLRHRHLILSGTFQAFVPLQTLFSLLTMSPEEMPFKTQLKCNFL